MNCWFSVKKIIKISMVCGLIFAQPLLSFAEEDLTAEALKQKSLKEEKELTKQEATEAQKTQLMLSTSENQKQSASQTPLGLSTDLTVGQDRAKAMVQMIQDVEMKKALEKITAQGNTILKKNPELKTPIAIFAGAASAWLGRTMNLVKSDDVKISTHVEGRARAGGFNMASPLVNGQLKYSQSDGASFGVNRSISSFNTSAKMNYNITNQAISTQLNQRIAPNLNLSVGAEQSNGTIDNKASVNYELHF